MRRRKPSLFVLVVVGLLAIAAAAGQVSAAAPEDRSKSSAGLRAQLRTAIVAQERASDPLLDLLRVVGTGVGLDAAGNPVVKVLATRPDLIGVPEQIDGVPTEVVVTGQFVAQHPNCPLGPQTSCVRPVPAGISTGHPDITAGTIGARVMDPAGNVYALSNNHVYANENQASLGDPILQPGTVDGGSAQNPDDLLGTLAQFEPIDFCESFFIFPMCDGVSNSIDAAIALVAPGDLLSETDCGFTPTSATVPVAALVPNVTQVKKCGRTTGLTTGTITAVNVQVDVAYVTGVARFENQIMTTDISDGGDSGSLIVNLADQPVALLFAGSETNSIGSPIDDVLGAFGVTIDDDAGGGDPGDTTPPAAPTGLAAVAGDGTVSLDWDDNGEPDLGGYRVYRSGSPGGPYALISAILAESDYVDPAATNGVTHYYVVRARDASGNESGDSNEATATPVNLAPATPTGLVGVAGDGEVALSWDLGVEADLNRYRVYRATASGGPRTLIATRNASTSSFTDAPVSNNVTYYYELAVTDLSGAESAPTVEVAVTPHVPDAVAPGAPTSLFAVGGDNQVTLDWDDNPEPDVVSYNVYRASSTGGPYALLASVAGSSYVDGSAVNGTTYFYVTRAVDSSTNESANSAQASATPQPPDSTAPVAPSGLVATAADGVVSLDWDDNGELDLAGYELRRSTSAGGPYTAITGLVGSSDHDDTTVVNGNTYYYVVVAEDASGNQSTDSNEASATPLDAPPATPTGLVGGAGDGQVALEWTPGVEPDLARTRIYRTSAPGGPYTLIASTNAATSQFVDTTVSNGTTYYYAISATDTAGNESARTGDVSATPGTPPPTAPTLESGVVSATTDGWTTVTLDNDYGSGMVVIATPNYDSATVPLVARVRNAAGTSFELGLGATAGSPSASAPVHWLAVQEGVYTAAEHGIAMEAHRFTSTVTDRRGSWVGESRTYSQAYTSPVVVGQVMSANDPAWSVFWARGGSRTAPPSASALFVGKHVAEDPASARADEFIGYVVIESGSGSIGSVDYAAALGADTIQGVGDAPPYTYSLSGLSTASAVVASSAAMDGGNGGWPILYGATPLTPTGLSLGYEEDQARDAERRHTHEQVAYVAFG